MNARKILITVISIIFILFGLSGAVFSSAGILFLNSHKEDIDNVHRLGQSTANALEEVAIALEGSDKKTANIAESVRAAGNTLGQASGICYESGVAFNKIAGIVGFEILGFNPLEEAEKYFSDIGNNLIVLSEELDKAGDSLYINASDIEETSIELKSVSEKIEDVSGRFSREINSFSIYNLALYIKYLLIYIFAINILFVLNGIVILSLGREKDR
jgi:archaellum component FlaC